MQKRATRIRDAGPSELARAAIAVFDALTNECAIRDSIAQYQDSTCTITALYVHLQSLSAFVSNW